MRRNMRRVAKEMTVQLKAINPKAQSSGKAGVSSVVEGAKASAPSQLDSSVSKSGLDRNIHNPTGTGGMVRFKPTGAGQMFAKSQSINEPSMVIPNTQSKRNAHSKLLLSLLSCAGGRTAPHTNKRRRLLVAYR